jgi:hypothetical protein
MKSIIAALALTTELTFPSLAMARPVTFTMRIEKPLAVAAHLARRDRTRHAIPLRPLHRRGNCNTETRGHRAAAFAGLERTNNTRAKIIG